jgi:hypothetical protein
VTLGGNKTSVNPSFEAGFLLGGFIPTCHAQPNGEMAKLESDMLRRQFIQRAAGVVGAIITPAFVEQAWANSQNGTAPLLRPPSSTVQYQLSAFRMEECYSLDLLHPDGSEIDTMPQTFGQMLKHFDYKEGSAQLAFVMEGWCLSRSEAQGMLQAPAPEDWAEIYTDRHGSPMARAYNFLHGLDLGPKLSRSSRHENRVGQINFIDSFHPGCDMLGVEVPDKFNLSLLQARLIELGQPVQVSVLD